MDVRWVAAEGIEDHQVKDLKSLLEREDGFAWVDIPSCDAEATQVLSEVFGFHPLAVRACTERNHIPRVHAYADHVLVVLNAPEPGAAGHVHLLELDQFIGHRYLVTVHGPLGAGVPLDAALRDTGLVLERLQAGRVHPGSPLELSYAIVSALARAMAEVVRALAATIAALERRILDQEHKDPERILHELFQVRHELLTVRTMAGQSREIYGRMGAVARFVPAEARPFIEDLMDQGPGKVGKCPNWCPGALVRRYMRAACHLRPGPTRWVVRTRQILTLPGPCLMDQFARVRSLCEDEQHFLQGVVEFYQTKLTTRINVAEVRVHGLAGGRVNRSPGRVG